MPQLTGAPSAAAVDSLDRSTVAKEPIGRQAFSEDGQYVYVRANGNITVSGDPVSAAALASVGVVRGDSDVGELLGVAEKPFASGEHGYVKTKGYVQAVLASGIAAGGTISVSSNVGQFKAYATNDTRRAAGVALEAADNGGDVKKWIYLF